jgi:hypothetical protein
LNRASEKFCLSSDYTCQMLNWKIMFVIEPSSAVRMSNLCHTIIMCLKVQSVLLPFLTKLTSGMVSVLKRITPTTNSSKLNT